MLSKNSMVPIHSDTMTSTGPVGEQWEQLEKGERGRGRERKKEKETGETHFLHFAVNYRNHLFNGTLKIIGIIWHVWDVAERI